MCLSGIAAAETKVVHTTVWSHKDAAIHAAETKVIHKTIWVHKDKAKIADPGDEEKVEEIMSKYLGKN